MSLKTKLIILLISFTLVPLVIFGSIIFTQARSILTDIRLAQLNIIADLKKDKIETFFREREADIRSAERFRNIRQNLPALRKHGNNKAHPEYINAREALDDQLRTFQESFGYLNVILADPQGNVVYASHAGRDTGRLGPLHDDKVLDAARKEIYFSDVFSREGADSHVEMLGMAPVRDFRGSLAGLVILEIDMEPIFQFIRDATGLGATGEALIARKEGDRTLFLSPLMRDPGAVLKRAVTSRDKAGAPAHKAAQGENGSGVFLDYAGEEVIAAWRYLPGLRWGLVTKIDAVEAFAPVRALKTVVISVGIFMILIGLIAATVIARSITRPIQLLQEGAEAIRAGDLRRRVGTGAQDEVGGLSRAFDAMTYALVSDIAEREKAEGEVRELNKALEHHIRQLEESNKELDAFSYSVSHDLRSPLRSIDGFSRALVEDYSGKLDEEGRDYLERIRGAAQRMAQLIDDLLKLSRVARMEAKRERVDLSAIAEDIAGRLRKNHPERKVRFNIAPGLAASGDERLLIVALENLFANAWKFSEKNPEAVIEFGIASVQGEPAFYVKDNGAGFDMAFADKLFNPFQRLHHADEYSGTGIGLATVKRIINRHGGRVWIESRINRGTTVYFTL